MTDQTIDTIGIIGYGQFGELLTVLINKKFPDIKVKVSSRSNDVDNKTFFEFEEVAKSEIIIPTVPIRFFEDCIKKLLPFLESKQTIMDVTSVKVYPKRVMLANLPSSINIVGTHPMWGPGTYKKTQSTKGLNLIIENIRASNEVYEKIKKFWQAFELNIVEMKAEDHDKIAAKSHFLTQLNAFIYREIDFKRTELDTYSTKLINDMIEVVKADRELTRDMYRYNPYCEEQLENFEKAYFDVKEFLEKE
jgi:prephenate dehydrogenase